ncbi:MAG: hypothetical protein Q9M14_03655 [Mariprofundaceae bacterium]|nr:hypothetical protein [Mariprofundaceae bacterium]
MDLNLGEPIIITTGIRNSLMTRMFTLSLALLGCLATKPYFVWNNKVVIVVVTLLTVILLLVDSLQIRDRIKFNGESLALGLFGIIVIFYFYCAGSVNDVPILGFLAVLVSLACFLFLNDLNKIEVYKTFKFLFAIFMIPGLFIWLLYLLGLPWDFFLLGNISNDQVLNPLKGAAGIYYKEFPASVVIGSFMDGNSLFFRFSGMYDEPGVIGTISGLLLTVERFKLLNWTNCILFVGGIASFSLAFIGIMILYMILTKNWKVILFMMLSVLGIYSFLPMEVQSLLTEQVIGRLVISSGAIQDNRETESLLYYWSLWQSGSVSQVIFGLNTVLEGDIGSTWKIVLIKQGIWGILILWVWLLLYTFKNYAGWISVVLTIVFAASFYQRPDVLYLPQMIIFIGGAIYLKEEQQREMR